MIDLKSDPLGWSFFMDELGDAHEHLGVLIAALGAGDCDEDDLRISLGHIYAHLNRGWFRRNVMWPDDLDGARRELASAFPSDIEPVG
jgi:hypothetical protein